LRFAAVADRAGDRLGSARNLGAIDALTRSDRIGKGDPADYYRFTVEGTNSGIPARRLTIALGNLAQNVEVQLLDGSGSVLSNANQTARVNGLATELIRRPLRSGTYYVRIAPGNGQAQTQYRLDLMAAPYVETNLPNNAPGFPAIALRQVASGLNQPTFVTSAKDGSNRLFVTEKGGQIKILEGNTVRSTPFLNLSNRVSTAGEDGLFSIAFPPNFASKRHFYVYYVNTAGNIVVSRFRVSAANPNVADANSEQVILSINHPNAINHNGGQLAFGLDGFLYLGTGDGGGSGDPANNAQNPGSLLGKLLRLDVESPGAAPYQVPTSNPFVGRGDRNRLFRDEIWSYGLRNPWRFSFDRQTGELYIGDVGQGAFEEVNVQDANSRGGQNYGWKIMEGGHRFNNSINNLNGMTLPVLDYDRTQGESVTGGYVYRGTDIPALQGTYLFGDFVSGKIWGLRRNGEAWSSRELLASPHAISSFGEDEQGNLYVVDFIGGTIQRVASS
jgi:glucose/arabinose dehydrogenase